MVNGIVRMGVLNSFEELTIVCEALSISCIIKPDQLVAPSS